MTELLKAALLVESKAAYWDSMTVDLKVLKMVALRDELKVA